MKALSVVFSPWAVWLVLSLSLQGGMEGQEGTGVLDFSTLGSLLVLTVCELDILCNNAVLKSALFMRAF